MNFTESIKNSISVHCKDRDEMVKWLNRTVDVMVSVGCTQNSCDQANATMLHNQLKNWSVDDHRWS